MSSTATERAREAIRAYLEVDDSGALPRTAVEDLATLAEWVDQTLRTAVLDRRMTIDTWDEIGKDLGVSPQAARKKYVAPGHPRQVGTLTRYTDRDAYYADRAALADAWSYRLGDHDRGLAPMGSDESSITIDGQRWALTVSCSPGDLRFDTWRRVGRPHHTSLGDVVATCVATGEVVVVGENVPIGPAARALNTLHGAKDLQDVANAIETECHRPDAVQPPLARKE